MLVNNFSSFHEPGEDPELVDVFSFETKPKSGVMEYVPTKIVSFIKENNSTLTNFIGSETCAQFLDN